MRFHRQPDRRDDWVHLFTSTIRELYIADAVDVLAAPRGAIVRFRYEERYVQPHLRTRWSDGSLIGLHAAVYFSLQHPADFHQATFIPLRQGSIVATWVEGSTHVVQFELASYLPLEEDPQWRRPRERAAPVKAFAEALRGLLGDHHPDAGIHAALGPTPGGSLHPSGDDGRDFEVLVRYMTPSLYFSPRVFFRIASIHTADGKELTFDRGTLRLAAGADYILEVAHYQEKPPAADVALEVAIPEGLTLYGEPELHLRSRYDVMPVSMFAAFRDDVAAGELRIATCPPAMGPTVRLPVHVVPTMGHSLSGPALGVGGAMALALPPVLAGGDRLALRLALVGTGTALAGLGLWLRRTKGLMP